MKGNILTGRLPTSVLIDGEAFEIASDYRVGIQLDALSRTEDMTEIKMLEKIVELYYTARRPANLLDAIQKALWFYRCGAELQDGGKQEKPSRYKRKRSKGPYYSFEQDAPYIYTAFQEQYGIDLADIEYMHWWKFSALFESLSDKTKMGQIMYYRRVSTSGMGNKERAYVNEMKKLYEIRDSSTAAQKITLAERNQRWIRYVDERHKDIMK